MNKAVVCPLMVGAGLAGVIAWEVGDFVPPLHHQTASLSLVQATAPDTTADRPADADPQRWLVTALDRPLFRDDRRPSPALETPSGTTLRLSGVVTGPFGGHAIFASSGDGRSIVLGNGARIGGVLVRSVEPGRVLVEVDGELRMLQPTPTGTDALPIPIGVAISMRARAG